MKNKRQMVEVNVKIVLLGDTDSGKNKIIQRFVDENFDLEYTSCIGIDYSIKIIKYKNKKYSIQFFDTSGQERFRSLMTSYYHLANGFFVVFDLTKENSLLSVRDWIESIEDNIKEPKIIILGNKDESKEKKIPDDIINKEIGGYKYKFIKVSSNKNITKAIEELIDLIEEESEKEDDNPFKFHKVNHKINLKKKEKSKKKIIDNDKNDNVNYNNNKLKKYIDF